MGLPSHVVIQEVGPRDGLQHEPGFVQTQTKVELVQRLVDAGCRRIEVSSFVHPRWIPALADADEVFASLRRVSGVEYSALVPNLKGLERALAARVDAVSVFMSASETHNRKNINKSIAETFPVLQPVIRQAKAAGLRVRGYVSTAFGCPYEGPVPVDQVVRVSQHLLEMGVDELSIGDTIGVAVPTQVEHLLSELAPHIPLSRVALHFHDTRGTALANIYAALEVGVSTFDASIGGLGGCPYAPGATGNVATEDVLYMLEGMGVATEIDTNRLMEVSEWLESELGRPLDSHASRVARSARMMRSASESPHASGQAKGKEKQASVDLQSSSAEPLLLRQELDDGQIVVLTLNRPRQRNALSQSLLARLEEELQRPKTLRARVLIFTGNGSAFCAGADLKERRTMDDQAVLRAVARIRGFVAAVARLPMPVITAIHGAALGGGLELALAADIRLCTEDAVFGLPETTLAIIPGAGGTQRLPRLIGPARAKELIYTGRRIDGKMALSIGLVNQVVDSSALMSTAVALARDIAQSGPLAVRQAKFAIDQGLTLDIPAGLRVEANAYAQLIPTTDRREALAAFAEHRPPRYQGR
ncbi:MAG: hydroxymethylglutaryl-CoA lyase [Alicyclobacillus herbarius]|nr:hydroxymethylglutaryl-CoA lyase [Alicyclobacillus herbarius]